LPNVRNTTFEKYNISSHRFMELYHFCMQYNEWKDELRYKCDAVGSPVMSDVPAAHDNVDTTSAIAIRRNMLSKKCEIIEQTAIEADPELYQYLIKAVTNEGITYSYLSTMMRIPCGKKRYYERRRRFYFLLSQKV